MGEYTVSWECETVNAIDAEDAAIEAWKMLRDLESLALVFEVEGPDGERVQVDLVDHSLRPLPTRREPDFTAYLAGYPHPLPPGASLASARMLPVGQLNRGDIILGYLELDSSRSGRPVVKPTVPRYAAPEPACGGCSPDCALATLHADLTGRTAMHTTSVGREVISPESADEETFHLTAFADDVCLVIPTR